MSEDRFAGNKLPLYAKGRKLPLFISAEHGIHLLGIGRSEFFDRVKRGIYRTAEVREGDRKPTKMLFRPSELVHDDLIRKLEARR